MTTAKQFNAHIFVTREQLFAKLTEVLVAEICNAATLAEVGGEGGCALAGGTTPQTVYEKLRTCNLPWAQTSFYPTDERCVAEDSSRRNDVMLRQCLGEQACVFSLQENASPPQLHVALLGMGEDGHIASLFADTTLEGNTIFRVTPASAPEPRLTIPLSAFVQAQKIFLLFCGQKKWQVLSQPSTPIATLLAQRSALHKKQVASPNNHSGIHKTEIFYAP